MEHIQNTEMDKMKHKESVSFCVAYKAQAYFTYVHSNQQSWDAYYKSDAPLTPWRKRLIYDPAPELVFPR